MTDLGRVREAWRKLARRYLVAFGVGCMTLGAIVSHDWVTVALVWLGLMSLSAWLEVIAK